MSPLFNGCTATAVSMLGIKRLIKIWRKDKWRIDCVYLFPQTKIYYLHAPTSNYKQLYIHTHWKLDTCLYELIYSEYSILLPPTIFTISPETHCIIFSLSLVSPWNW